MLAAVLALSLAACGGEKKPVGTTDITDTSQTDTSQTDSSQIDSSQTDTSQTEKEQPEAESAEAETKIPENATEILLTNPKIQAQAKFYFPKEAKEWETKWSEQKGSGQCTSEICVSVRKCRWRFVTGGYR